AILPAEIRLNQNLQTCFSLSNTPSENRKYPFRRPEVLIFFCLIRIERLFQLSPSNAFTLRIKFEDWFTIK
ncbi:MAG: hypothetical protein KHW43_03365, partial [Neisseria sp.]|nr:hypothetical protein [Neisseria sp.]